MNTEANYTCVTNLTGRLKKFTLTPGKLFVNILSSYSHAINDNFR